MCVQPRFSYQNMTEGLRLEVVVRLPRCQPVEIGSFLFSHARSLLFTNKLPSHLPKIPFGRLAELIVAAHLFADNTFSAVIDRVKPFGVRRRTPIDTIESHPRSQFYERTALRQLRRFFKLHANPGGA